MSRVMKKEAKRYRGMPSRPHCSTCFGSGVMDFGLGEYECSDCDGIGYDNMYTGLDLEERLCLDQADDQFESTGNEEKQP